MNETSYSTGTTIKNSVVQIWNDLSNERSGMYRAYWCASPEAESGSPVVGYCSPGGSHSTIRAAVAETVRLHPGTPCYRNGKLLNPSTARL